MGYFVRVHLDTAIEPRLEEAKKTARDYLVNLRGHGFVEVVAEDGTVITTSDLAQ